MHRTRRLLLSKKKRLVSSQNSPSWKQIPPKWSMLRTTKASDAPPIQNDGAKSAHSHKSPWFQATIQCTQPHDQHRSKVLVQQIKAGTPDLDISLTLITTNLINFFTKQPTSRINNSTINTVISKQTFEQTSNLHKSTCLSCGPRASAASTPVSLTFPDTIHQAFH
jgi:hypothetical protein